jgi:4-amino-4-deoxy-L-arabinose transferase-like glycosyltransferase
MPRRPPAAPPPVPALGRPWALGVVVALAVVLRVAHVLALRATPWFDHLVIDPQYYDAWARQLAGGEWLGTRPFYMDPLYPYLLGAFYRVWGPDLLAARLLNVAMSGVTCVLVARLGTRVAGPVAGTLAALGFALYVPDVFYTGEIDKTSLSVMLVAATLVAFLGASPASRFGAGILLGLAALTRANVLVFAPLGVVTLLVRRETRAAALFAAGLALALAPVVWRNHRVSGEWVLTTAQAGQNFYTGNNATNDYGAYDTPAFVRGNPHFEELDFRAEAERRAGRPLTAREVSSLWWREALASMAADPGRAALVMARKLALFWNDFEVADNQDQYLLAHDSWVLRLPVGFGVVASLALLGAIVTWRRPATRVLVVFVAVYCASVVAFFIFSRYRIQVVPALLPLAAAGVLAFATRDARTLARNGAIVALGALCSFPTIAWFDADHPRVVEMRLRHLGQAYLDDGRPDEAIAAFHEGLAGCPASCPLGTQALADAYVVTGRLADGEAYFRRLTHEHPTWPEGWRQLARILEARGRADEARDALRRGGIRAD